MATEPPPPVSDAFPNTITPDDVYNDHAGKSVGANNPARRRLSFTINPSLIQPPPNPLRRRPGVYKQREVISNPKEIEQDVKAMLDKLLSSQSEDLDGDGAVSILQELLDVKPIDLSTLSIPNFKNTGTLNQKQMETCVKSSLKSSTRRSLKGSLSALRKHVMQSNSLVDLFSPYEPDLIVQRRRSSKDVGSKSVDPNNVEDAPDLPVEALQKKESDTTVSPIDNHEITRLEEKNVKYAPNLEMSYVEGLKRTEKDTTVLSIDNHEQSQTKENVENLSLLSVEVFEKRENDMTILQIDKHKLCQTEENVEDAQNLPMPSVEVLQKIENDMTVLPIDNHKPRQKEGNVEDAQNLPMPSVEVFDTTENDTTVLPIDKQEPRKTGENVEDAQNLPMPSVEVFQRTKNDLASLPIDNHKSSEMEENVKDMTLAHDGAAKECTLEKIPAARVSISEQETAIVPFQEQKRRSKVGKSESKILSKRKSILDGGTSFESGVRRSKRFKTRPLEYWRGERPLRSRVDGIIQLTGIQYVSPSNDDKGMLMVRYIGTRQRVLHN